MEKISDKKKLDFIYSLICSDRNIDISTRSRQEHIVGYRWVYIQLAVEFTYCSSRIIGSLIKRDHATIVYHKNNKVAPDDKWVRYKDELRDICIKEFNSFKKTNNRRASLINRLINLKVELACLKKNKETNEMIDNFNKLNNTRKREILDNINVKLKIQNKLKEAA